MKKKRKLSKIRLNPENPNNQNYIFLDPNTWIAEFHIL